MSVPSVEGMGVVEAAATRDLAVVAMPVSAAAIPDSAAIPDILEAVSAVPTLVRLGLEHTLGGGSDPLADLAFKAVRIFQVEFVLVGHTGASAPPRTATAAAMDTDMAIPTRATMTRTGLGGGVTQAHLVMTTRLSSNN